MNPAQAASGAGGETVDHGLLPNNNRLVADWLLE